MMRLLLAALLLALPACGWHAGLVAPEGAESIGVEAARRAATVLERGLEPRFTDALSDAVVDWVDLELSDPAEADWVLRAEILEYRRRGGVRNQDNELIETAVFVRARAELVERRTGRRRGPVQAQEWSGYALEDVENELPASERALRHVAASLILDLFGGEALAPIQAAPASAPLTPQ
ncbi:MAG: hypothetical protein ABL998_15825 [Planctomycetota bacterium]